jgi:hypothetical protein
MPKMLALIGLIVSVIILLVMIVDLAWTRASLAMNIGFIICSLGLGVLSFLTYREQS